MAQGGPMALEEAEALAVEALAFVAGDDVLLGRFLALTGIEANQIRRAAAEPGFLAGVLGFLTAHEPTLLAFGAASGRDPASVVRALDLLPQGNSAWDVST